MGQIEVVGQHPQEDAGLRTDKPPEQGEQEQHQAVVQSHLQKYLKQDTEQDVPAPGPHHDGKQEKQKEQISGEQPIGEIGSIPGLIWFEIKPCGTLAFPMECHGNNNAENHPQAQPTEQH